MSFLCCCSSRSEARRVFNRADFRELTKEYDFTNNEEVFREGEWKQAGWTETIQMRQPRHCYFYRCHDDGNEEHVVIGEMKESSRDDPQVRLPVTDNAAFRGITTRQLRAVWANAKRRCKSEKWTDQDGKLLTPDRITMHDINRFVIRPFTVTKRKSFVELLPSTNGPQNPRWYCNFWWGDTLQDIMACLDQHRMDFADNDGPEKESAGGGMTEDTPYWISAFAMNVWDIEAHGVDPPTYNDVFNQAMTLSDGRTINIIDRRGIATKRISFVCTQHRALVHYGGLCATYTAHEHIWRDAYNDDEELRYAVGMVPGGATSDIGDAVVTTSREEHFPYYLIEKILQTKVESARASSESTRVAILKSILGEDIVATIDKDENLPRYHQKYTFFNHELTAAFSASFGILQAAAREGEDAWKLALGAMSRGKMDGGVEFDFQEGSGWDDITASQAGEMISYLPRHLESLSIENAPFGEPLLDGIITWIKKSENIKLLKIKHFFVGGPVEGREAGIRLAKTLKGNKTLEGISLCFTDFVGVRNASHWSSFIASSTTLKNFECYGMGAYARKMNFNEDQEPGIVKYPNDDRQSLHLEDAIFPDAMLTDEGLKILAKGIGSSTSLEYAVDLRHHQVGAEGIESLLPALMEKKILTKLNIFEDDEEAKREVNNALLRLEQKAVESNMDIEITNSW